MAGEVVNIEACNPLKLCSGLTGNYHATERSELMSYKRIICHYSFNLPLCATLKNSFVAKLYLDLKGKIKIPSHKQQFRSPSLQASFCCKTLASPSYSVEY